MAESGRERPGGMAAVLGLEVGEVNAICDAVSDSGVCVLANDNCPGQLVVSGDFNAVQALSALAMDRGAKRVIPLNVSGAFHSPLMKSSAETFRADLERVNFQAGTAPVYSNVTTEPGSGWPDLLERQLASPVRWTESIQRMILDGMTTFVECGSGEVLTGLLRRIDKAPTGLRVVDTATLADSVSRVQEAS